MAVSYDDRRVASHGRVATRGALVSYALMIAAWTFDFRSEGAGRGLDVQIWFLFAYGVAFAAFVWTDCCGRVRIPGLRVLTVSTAVYIGIAVASGLLRGQETYQIFRHAFTILIYWSAAYASARMIVQCAPAKLRQILGVLCLCFSVSSFLIVFLQGGVDLATVRFEILGASTTAALGLLILSLVFALSLAEFAASISAIILVVLSVTRSALIAVAAQALLLLPLVRRLGVARLLLFGAIGSVVGITLFMHDDAALERWVDRLFVSSRLGHDPTYVTRYYESEYMWDEFLSSSNTVLTGSGLAAPTSWFVSAEEGGEGQVVGSIGFGHNQHLSLLFTAGLLGGGPLLIVQFAQVLQGLRFLRRVSSEVDRQRDLAFLGGWGVAIILGSFSTNFLSAGFGNRGASLWYGIGTGLFLGAKAYLGSPRATLGNIRINPFPRRRALAEVSRFDAPCGAPPRMGANRMETNCAL